MLNRTNYIIITNKYQHKNGDFANGSLRKYSCVSRLALNKNVGVAGIVSLSPDDVALGVELNSTLCLFVEDLLGFNVVGVDIDITLEAVGVGILAVLAFISEESVYIGKSGVLLPLDLEVRLAVAVGNGHLSGELALVIVPVADDAVSIDGVDYLPVGKTNSYKDYELIYYINDVTIR